MPVRKNSLISRSDLGHFLSSFHSEQLDSIPPTRSIAS